VSVVIPTVLRPELVRALSSTRLDPVVSEVVLVVDAVRAVLVPPAVRGLADKVLFTGGGRGAASARNLGVAAAAGRWIAFLDDDDEFLPGKLAAQSTACAQLAQEDVRPIVSCRSVHRWEGGDKVSDPIPSKLYRDGDRLEDYLFRRRQLGVDRAAVFAPTLMVEADLAREVAWDETLARHQDWDFLLRAVSLPDVVLHQLPLTGTVCWFGATGSISADANWEASLAWVRRWRDGWAPATYVDFLTSQTLRYALHARSFRGCMTTLAEIARARGVPSRQALALGFAGVVPRGVLENVSAAVYGRPT